LLLSGNAVLPHLLRAFGHKQGAGMIFHVKST